MFSIDILLNKTVSVRSFVNITNDYPYQILLRQGRSLVDGKSLLGVCSLNLANPITVEAYTDQSGPLLAALHQFET